MSYHCQSYSIFILAPMATMFCLLFMALYEMGMRKIIFCCSNGRLFLPKNSWRYKIWTLTSILFSLLNEQELVHFPMILKRYHPCSSTFFDIWWSNHSCIGIKNNPVHILWLWSVSYRISLKDTSLNRSLACPSGRARAILNGTQLVHPPGWASGARPFLAGLTR